MVPVTSERRSSASARMPMTVMGATLSRICRACCCSATPVAMAERAARHAHLQRLARRIQQPHADLQPSLHRRVGIGAVQLILQLRRQSQRYALSRLHWRQRARRTWRMLRRWRTMQLVFTCSSSLALSPCKIMDTRRLTTTRICAQMPAAHEAREPHGTPATRALHVQSTQR